MLNIYKLIVALIFVACILAFLVGFYVDTTTMQYAAEGTYLTETDIEWSAAFIAGEV